MKKTCSTCGRGVDDCGRFPSYHSICWFPEGCVRIWAEEMDGILTVLLEELG
jgi:hypothetical protein